MSPGDLPDRGCVADRMAMGDGDVSFESSSWSAVTVVVVEVIKEEMERGFR
jgi:acetamidase/formamidase